MHHEVVTLEVGYRIYNAIIYIRRGLSCAGVAFISSTICKFTRRSGAIASEKSIASPSVLTATPHVASGAVVTSGAC